MRCAYLGRTSDEDAQDPHSQSPLAWGETSLQSVGHRRRSARLVCLSRVQRYVPAQMTSPSRKGTLQAPCCRSVPRAQCSGACQVLRRVTQTETPATTYDDRYQPSPLPHPMYKPWCAHACQRLLGCGSRQPDLSYSDALRRRHLLQSLSQRVQRRIDHRIALKRCGHDERLAVDEMQTRDESVPHE
jgi:hypothetical protein